MAEQLELFLIRSPCINVCHMDKRGYCSGCFRSRDERFAWQKLSESEKKQVLRLCASRKRRAEQSVTQSPSIATVTQKTDTLNF